MGICASKKDPRSRKFSEFGEGVQENISPQYKTKQDYYGE